MATRTNLEQAVKAQAKQLDPAQKEFVLIELNTYMWNKKKIESLQAEIESGDMSRTDEKAAVSERHQLVTENSALYGHITKMLQGTAAEESELDSFLNGN